MSDQLKITLIQTSLHWEDVDANLKMFDKKITSVKKETDLIILPEMFTTGFSMNVKFAETMHGKAMQWMAEKAKQKNCVITGSLMIKDSLPFGEGKGGAYFNRLIWMKPNGKFECYDKRHLFRYGAEDKFFTAGKKRLVVELNGWRICPQICYDLRFPVWIRNRNDYDLLIFVASWPTKRVEAWRALLRARAIENQSYVIGVSRVGVDGNNIEHSGESSVIDFKGKILFQRANKEIIYTTTLSKDSLEKFRSDFPFLLDRDEFTIKA